MGPAAGTAAVTLVLAPPIGPEKAAARAEEASLRGGRMRATVSLQAVLA